MPYIFCRHQWWYISHFKNCTNSVALRTCENICTALEVNVRIKKNVKSGSREGGSSFLAMRIKIVQQENGTIWSSCIRALDCKNLVFGSLSQLCREINSVKWVVTDGDISDLVVMFSNYLWVLFLNKELPEGKFYYLPNVQVCVVTDLVLYNLLSEGIARSKSYDVSIWYCLQQFSVV
jgi:hypothetical protein